jgi:hypothetical protein
MNECDTDTGEDLLAKPERELKNFIRYAIAVLNCRRSVKSAVTLRILIGHETVTQERQKRSCDTV